MLRRKLIVMLVVALSLAVGVPVLAAAPAEGVVHEGASVPGIELGSSRAQVQAAYGEPSSCQSGSAGGDSASCAYPVDGGGRVWVHYRGADGGGPSNSPDDVAYHIRWEEGVSGWTTTAGVNTALARADPEAVVAAYPNAQVTYTSWGSILEVKDYELGIQVNWWYHFYSGTVSIGMAISAPSEPPPPPEPVTRVTSISMTANKIKGKRTVTAFVAVDDERWQDAAGATVVATWSLPDGTELGLEAVTSSSGQARFEVRNAKPGTHSLTVKDVLLPEHRFDRDSSSVLSRSLDVK